MEFRVLQYFLAVVREENITRAAEVLHLTQPTLSRQMAQLEEELGVQLFIRGKHLQLTDAGIMLRRRAEEVVALMGKIESEFEEQAELGGIISIGSGGLLALEFLSTVLDSFRKKYPKAQYELYTNSAEYVKERLEQGLLDFGVLLEPIDVTKFEYIRMKERERWGLFLNVEHPLAQKECIEKSDLLHIPIITTNRLTLQRVLENWLEEDLSRLNIFATHNIITNVVSLVDKGIASALTIEGAVNLFESSRMVFRPLYPELSLSTVFVWKKFQPNLGIAGKFLEHFKTMHKEHALS